MPADSVFVSIDKKNRDILEDFLSSAGNSLQTFRYYDKRDINVTENHICTYILMENNRPIGYGHLDQENDIIWLGIAIIEAAQGKGYGKKMLVKLFEKATELDIKTINLSVDADNEKAIQLYKKNGFVFQKTINKTQFFQKKMTP